MSKKKGPMQPGILMAGLVLALLAIVPYAGATPTTVGIHFSGSEGSGYANLTIAPDPDASTNYQPTFSQSDANHNPPISPPLSQYDPAGAAHITGASGTFSDATLGISNASIIGVVPTSPGKAPPGETLPRSFSWLTAGANSYDNLFYPNGSPLVCPPAKTPAYTFHGGFLDIFGVMFALDNGDVVSLWSDGVVPPHAFGTPGGLTYGLSVFTPATGGFALTSTQFAGVMASVPGPGLLWLFGAGVLGLFAWRRSAEKKRLQAFN